MRGTSDGLDMPLLLRARTSDVYDATIQTAAFVAHRPVKMTTKSMDFITYSIKRSLTMNKERCKAMLLDTTYQVRHQVLTNFRDLIKSAFAQDPNFPEFLKKHADIAVDTLWTDIEDEIERDLEAAMLEQLANKDVEGPSSSWWTISGLLRVRAFLLHHFFPHDKSIFGKLKDPVYISLYLLMLTPISSVHFVVCSCLLCMLLLPGPPDEYQLLNYIMMFKGLQFLSQGLLKAAKAAMFDYYCYTVSKDDLMECANAHGPAATTPLDAMLDYSGTIVLTWIAALMLNRSKAYARPRYHIRGDDSDEESNKKRAGGRLRALLEYDLFCFLVSIIMLVLLTSWTCEGDTTLDLLQDTQFSANIFWCNVFWSLCTFPFLPLNVSFIFVALSRTVCTGFNENGACVAFEISLADAAESSSENRFIRRTKQLAEKSVALAGRFMDFVRRKQPPEVEQPGFVEEMGNLACSLWQASEQKGEMVKDMVPSPEQIMLVWDRY